MTRAKKRTTAKRKVKEDDLTPIEIRAHSALHEKWPEDAECMGGEVLYLIAVVRLLRRQLKRTRSRAAQALGLLAGRISTLEERALPGER